MSSTAARLWTRQRKPSSGARTDTTDQRGNTPLHEAAVHNLLEIGLWLLRQGANVNARNRANDRPLHLAARNGHPDTTDLLLAWKADPRLTNNKNETALDLAAKSRFHERPAYQATITRLEEPTGDP